MTSFYFILFFKFYFIVFYFIVFYCILFYFILFHFISFYFIFIIIVAIISLLFTGLAARWKPGAAGESFRCAGSLNDQPAEWIENTIAILLAINDCSKLRSSQVQTMRRNGLEFILERDCCQPNQMNTGDEFSLGFQVNLLHFCCRLLFWFWFCNLPPDNKCVSRICDTWIRMEQQFVRYSRSTRLSGRSISRNKEK